MKYLISENRLMNIMEKFFHERFPNIELPLITKSSRGKGNSGWGSSMHDYTYINTRYFDQNGDILFIEFDDRYDEDSKWEVNNMLEPMYDYFGEEAFEEFVKHYFGLDIKNPYSKKYNWLFR